MEFKCRVANQEDADAILRIHQQAISRGDCFVQSKSEFKETVESKVAFIKTLKTKDNSNIFVVLADDAVIGWLFLSGYPLEKLKHVAMLGMAIDENWQNKKAGQAMVAHAIHWAKNDSPLKRIGLAVFASNTPAIKLYQNAGFTIEGRERQEVLLPNGEYTDQVLMGLILL